MNYEVQLDGKTVWSEDGPDSFDREVFPEEFRGRPASGAVTLLTDGNVISISTPLPDDYEGPVSAAERRGGGHGQGTVTVPGE